MPETAKAKPKYSKEFWEKLFDRYYHDEIIKLAGNFPVECALKIEFANLKLVWGRMGETTRSAIEYLVNNPEKVLEDGNETLRNLDKLPANLPDDWLTKAHVEIAGVEPVMTIRDIRHEHIGKFVAIKGTILRKTEVRYKPIEAAFLCQRCDHVTHLIQPDGELVEPFECENEVCGRKGPFKFLQGESLWADKRKIRLQETSDQIIGGEQSLSVLDAEMYDNVECPPLGSRVTVSGTLRGVQTVIAGIKSSDFYPILKVNHIEAQDHETTVEPTNEELKVMEEMAKDRNIIERLVASTVPSVRGHELIKEAVLCSQVSPESLLLPDGRKLRGPSHIMLCGDPGVAKSVMLLAMCANVPRAQYAAGRSASSRGLTVSVTKDKGGWGEGAWVAEAGMLVLADRAFAVIDELDKFEKEEQRDLNTVLEHGIVPLRKAGINRDYFARVPIVASLNPKNGRFDQYEPIPKQVNVPPDTLSRFDLIFMMFDVPKKDDELTADHITNLWQKATEVHQKEFEGMKALTKSWDIDKYVPEISLDMMRKWIYVAKKIQVRITSECRSSLNDYFMEIRLSQSGDADAAIPIAWRTLDGMMRLVICETRLRHGKVTEIRDVERVKALVKESFKVMTDPETGKLDSDIISVGMGKSQRDRIKILKAIIKERQDELEGAVPLAEILEKAVESGIKEDDVEDMLKKLKTDGEVIEASNRRFRIV
ncbi:minichromosome maintenance protein MCM [Patescibacteria group bacterium]|nr:minichromosome maintenance protein MCM [Patescibacteria group bacterium]